MSARTVLPVIAVGWPVQTCQKFGPLVLQAWSAYLAAGSFQPLADNPAAGIRCETGACLLRPYGDRAGALLAQGSQHPSGCDQVSVIISAEPARGLCPRPWPDLVDRFTVWRSGSAAIWLER